MRILGLGCGWYRGLFRRSDPRCRRRRHFPGAFAAGGAVAPERTAGLQSARRHQDQPAGRDPRGVARRRSLRRHVLSCKSYDLASAIDAIAPAVGEQSVILPLLNGVRTSRRWPRASARRASSAASLSSRWRSRRRAKIRHLNALHRLAAGSLTAMRRHGWRRSPNCWRPPVSISFRPTTSSRRCGTSSFS